MNFVWCILIGAMVGVAARILLRVERAGGIVTVSAIGVAGSSAAYYAGHASGWYGNNEPASLVSAAIGAVFLLAVHFVASSKPH